MGPPQSTEPNRDPCLGTHPEAPPSAGLRSSGGGPTPADSEAWLRSRARPVGRRLAAAVGLSVVGGLLVLLQAYLLAGIVDAVIFHQAALGAVAPALAALLAVYAGRFAASWLSEQMAFAAAADVKRTLRERLLRRLGELGPAWQRTQQSGDLVTSIVDGVDALDGYYARYLPQMGAAALVPLSMLVFVVPRDWFSAAVFLLTLPLIPLFMVLIGNGAERLNQRQWVQLRRLAARFLDAIQGLTTLRLLNASRRELDVVARLSDEYRRTTMGVLRVAFLSALSLELLATLSIAVVAVFIGFRLYGAFTWAPIDFRTGLFVLLLAPEVYLPLRELGARYHARMEAIGATGGILDVLAAPVPDVRGGGAALPEGALRIEVGGAHYAYPDGRVALRGVDLRLEPGKVLALIGSSGAGKSTLANLLLGFVVPDQGSVRVDGQDLAGIDADAWRSAVAWVPQRPQLLYGTLSENLLLARPTATTEEVWRALEQAGAADLVAGLPAGLQTVVGEQGVGLSGGEIQRIALARAFLRDARLVVLDEPTANLDATAAGGILATLRRLKEGRVVLVIAHRLATAAVADVVAVLEEGCVVETGSPAELATRGGRYAALVRWYGGRE